MAEYLSFVLFFFAAFASLAREFMFSATVDPRTVFTYENIIIYTRTQELEYNLNSVIYIHIYMCIPVFGTLFFRGFCVFGPRIDVFGDGKSNNCNNL